MRWKTAHARRRRNDPSTVALKRKFDVMLQRAVFDTVCACIDPGVNRMVGAIHETRAFAATIDSILEQLRQA